MFVRHAGRQLRAKKTLANRVQSGSTKAEHILKGIADDAFNLVVFRNCGSAETIVDDCRRFEHAKNRASPPFFSRNPAQKSHASPASSSRRCFVLILLLVKPPYRHLFLPLFQWYKPWSAGKSQATVSRSQCPPYHIPPIPAYPPMSAAIFFLTTTSKPHSMAYTG